MTNSAIPKPHVAVRAIIKNAEGKVLVLKRSNTSYSNGLWNLPGGKIDFGETTLEALQHEIKEETNLILADSRFLFYMDNLPDEHTDLHFVTLFFDCTCTGEIQLNNESIRYRWIKQNEIAEIGMAFGNDEALIRYIKRDF